MIWKTKSKIPMTSKGLNYIVNNFILLFEVQEKYRKQKFKSCKNLKGKNNAFMKMLSSLQIWKPVIQIPLLGSILF